MYVIKIILKNMFLKENSLNSVDDYTRNVYFIMYSAASARFSINNYKYRYIIFIFLFSKIQI